MEIVTATLDSLDELAPLFDAYRGFYARPSDLDAARAYLRQRILLGESVVYLARTQDGALGFTQLYPTFSSLSLKRLWVLSDLFVIPEARGRRVGEALLNAAIGLARATDAAGLVLETAHDNVSGQRLYERVGFTRTDLEFRTYFLETS